MAQVSCGGWRRPYSYYLGTVPEYQNCFAFVKVCVLNCISNVLWILFLSWCSSESQHTSWELFLPFQNLHVLYLAIVTCFWGAGNSELVTDGENNWSIPPTLEGWVYIIPIHGPLDGPLDTWAQYTPTPPRRLNYRHSGVQDWTTIKLTPPRSLNNRRSGVQDWTRREYK